MMWWYSGIVRSGSARTAPTQRLSLMDPKHVNPGKCFATEARNLQWPGRNIRSVSWDSSPRHKAKLARVIEKDFADCPGELRPGLWRYQASVAKYFPRFTCFGFINERRCVGALLALLALTITLDHHIIISQNFNANSPIARLQVKLTSKKIWLNLTALSSSGFQLKQKTKNVPFEWWKGWTKVNSLK